MKELKDSKINFYVFTNIILFLTNLVLIFFTYQNPLTIKWLMIFYLVVAAPQIIFLVYIYYKTFYLQEKITPETTKYKVYDWISSLLIPVSVFIMIFGNIVVNGQISQRSMEPTLHDGQTILIYKFEYLPKVDDVIVISQLTSSNENELIIKRVIAVPGDKIRYEKDESLVGDVGQIYVNDKLYENRYLKEQGQKTVFTLAEFKTMFKHQYKTNSLVPLEVTLANNYYLALGDNFLNSSDSRDYGAFNIHNIGGKMIYSFGGNKQ